MKESNIDRLFKNKLEHQSQEPSDDAKAKFYALVDKKEKKAVWMWWQIAAAVLVLAISSIILWQYQSQPTNELVSQAPKNEVPSGNGNPTIAQNESSEEAANEIDSTKPEETKVPEPVVGDEPMVAQLNTEPEAEQEIEMQSQEDGDTKQPELRIEKLDVVVAVEDSTLLKPIQNIALDSAALDKSMLAEVEEPTNTEKKRLPVTIIYKSSKADDSFIAMQQFQEDIDSLENDQSKSLRSIIQTAANSSLISELRNAKNDILKLDIPQLNKKANN